MSDKSATTHAASSKVRYELTCAKNTYPLPETASRVESRDCFRNIQASLNFFLVYETRHDTLLDRMAVKKVGLILEHFLVDLL